jgi:hypothetical protein
MSDDTREVLQRFLDNLFRDQARVSRLDVIIRAETLDLDADLIPIIANLPSVRSYTRQRLADQLNSAIVGHGLSRQYGTVD